MSDKMKIGELLLLREKVDPWQLSHALKEQAHTRQRLISMLLNRALLDPDEGALLLSEQLGYPAALQRHLERRDAKVLGLVPAQLGSRWVVLPIGRARTGALIVVARDPTPILSAALEHATRTSILLSVTPAVQLERLVRAAYGGAGSPEEPLPELPPTMSDIGQVRLEDATPLPARRGRTVSFAMPEMPELPVRPPPSPLPPIETTLAEIDRAITAGAVERIVMAYAAKRWRAALLAKLDGTRAVGVRGHGSSLDQPERIAIPMVPPSMLTIARDTRHATTERPVSPNQHFLHRLLETPSAPAAAPVIVGDHVDAVLAVGDVVDGTPTDSLAELDRLADALGAAYVRFSR